jgi:hypothetical protein
MGFFAGCAAMRVARNILYLGSFLALGAGNGALALAFDGWEWDRSAPLTKTYDIETPCNAEQVALASVRPMPIGTARLSPVTQVVCQKDGLIFASGTTGGVDGELPDGQTVFDIILSEIAGTGETLPDGAYDLIDGRRAIQNRESANGIVAQTTIIELSDLEVLMMLAGGPFEGSGFDLDVGALIDRHANSLEIAQ